MKHIFCYILAVLSISACQFKTCEIRPLSASQLEEYGCSRFVKNVCIPLAVVDAAMDFDEYLLLPDEEKESHRFHNKTFILGKGVYSVADGADGYVKFVVDTHEKPLSAEGNVWDIVQIHAYAGASQLKTHSYYELELEGEYSLRKSGNELEYRLENDGGNTLEFTLTEVKDDEWISFMISLSASERTDSYGADFSVDYPMSVIKNDSFGWIFGGTFIFSTYRLADNAELDSGTAFFKAGYLTKFNVSR